MPLEEVLRVVDALEATGCPHWLEGGWGIDALAGHQTRDHQDVDIDVDASREGEVIAALQALGYRETLDERPTRFGMHAPGDWCVDVHPLHLDPSGDARQQAPDGSWWCFRREWFTTGRLGDRTVPCYTADGQRHFHTGYELRAVDVRDLSLLDRLAVRSD